MTDLHAERIVFNSGSRLFVLPAGTIDALRGAGNYVSVLAEGRDFLVRETLAHLSERLRQHGFVRVDRSAIVNLGNVRELRRRSRTRFSLRFASGRELTISNEARARLEQALAPTPHPLPFASGQ